jgi:DNA-binding transcriptional ArsR family regulator
VVDISDGLVAHSMAAQGMRGVRTDSSTRTGSGPNVEPFEPQRVHVVWPGALPGIPRVGLEPSVVSLTDTISTPATIRVPMPLRVDPGLIAVFGSETRVLTLAPLANSPRALTAYRIATMTGVQRTKVYRELARLAEAGIVEERVTGPGRSEWELLDPDLRRLLRRRARIVWAEDLGREAPALARRTRRLMTAARQNPIDPALLRKPLTLRNPEDFVRSPAKDELLRRMGLRVSRHAARSVQ